MTARLPTWALKMARIQGERTYQSLIEYRLTGVDVSKLLNVDRASVYRWATNGRQGVVLRSKVFHSFHGRPRYFFRLWDVRQFAKTFTMFVDLDMLPATLRAEWKV